MENILLHFVTLSCTYMYFICVYSYIERCMYETLVYLSFWFGVMAVTRRWQCIFNIPVCKFWGNRPVVLRRVLEYINRNKTIVINKWETTYISDFIQQTILPPTWKNFIPRRIFFFFHWPKKTNMHYMHSNIICLIYYYSVL